MDWVAENWDVLAGAGAALVVLIGFIVRLTPSKKDDKVFEAVTGRKPGE